MLCVLMQALGIDICKMTEQATARPRESGEPTPPGASAAPPRENPEADPANAQRLASSAKTGAAHPRRQTLNYPPPCTESSS